MDQYAGPGFDSTFGALADPTRRGVLEVLGRRDSSITDLADRFGMTLTGMKKHIGVLEQAGLVATEKVGRIRTCRLGTKRLEAEMDWITRHQRLWAARFAGLDAVVAELLEKDPRNDNQD